MREFSAHPHSQGNSPMTATIHESPAQVKQAPAAIAVSGLVDLADGHAFVRISGYRRGPDDIYVSAAQIRQYGLRKGDLIEGTARPQPNGTARGKFRPLLAVATVNGKSPGLPRPHFDDLTPLYPDERLRLEDGNPSATARIIDLLAPIGKGQRGLIVAPPKAGKTMVLQAIATAIANSHPEVTLMLVLVGARPGKTPLGNRRRRGGPARLHHPARPCLQPGRARQQPDPGGRGRGLRPAAAAPVPRRRPQHRRRRLAHHRVHRAGG